MKQHNGRRNAPHDHATDGAQVGAASPDGTQAGVTKPPCFVVAIGASAGGQEALERIFTTLPTDCDLAFLVAMHLPPDGPSFLAEMLSRYTTMPVVTVEEGMPLQPNRVHVLPAGRSLAVCGNLLHLEETRSSLEAPFHPIDRLFRSLAGEAGERAIAVVLSGSGSDGAQGVKMVKEAGGTVIVQEPASAAYPAMPRSAIATGTADLILAAEEMAVKIAEIARGECVLPERACRVTTLDEDMETIFSIVKARTGHDFSSYKSNTVLRRIERRMAVNDTAGLSRYIALLREDSQEAHALCQDILIGVTSFFRDPEAFAALSREVIPRLFAGRSPDEPVRIWHACCASGEEVYSMAMLIREYLHERKRDANVLIFATDIDEVAIAQARSGLYGDDIEADVGAERLAAFFTRNDGRWQVTKQLREMVVFAHHSLIKDPPFSRLDLLVCRNFLIYLTPDMQKRLIALFHQVLKPGGVLFLGSAETVGRGSELFTVIDKKWKIFERREGEHRPETPFTFAASARKFPGTGRSPRPAAARENSPGAIAEKLLMARYCPPCVVVNEKYEVVHVSTRMRRFLEVPLGEPTRDILRMAREELRPALRAAIYKVFSEQHQADFRGVKLVDNGVEMAVNVVVEPLDAPKKAGKLAMVVFEQAPATSPPAPGANEAAGGEEASRDMLVRQLEEQLRVTHEQLQATTEQLETSHEGFLSANEELMSINEEFQSANEELQSTNEELETSKEELQALNGELITVNAELQTKVEELDQANSDMENLIASSGIATLFLDRQLNIRGFTPAAATIFNLIRSDVGRPFRHFAGRIDWPTLAQDAETVLAGQPFAEREVASLDGERCYLKRIFPYRTPEDRIDGIVVTFIDISERKRMEDALRRAKDEWECTFDNMPDLITVMDEHHRITRVNKAMAERLGTTTAECIGQPCYRGVHGTDRPPEFCPHTMTMADGRQHTVEVEEERLGGIFLVTTTPLVDERGQTVGSVHVARDITEQKRAEEALRESEGLFRTLADAIPQLCWMANADGWITWYNQRWYDYTGTTPEQMEGWGWQSVHDPRVLPNVMERWQTSIASGVPFDMVFPLRGADGVFRPFLTRVLPVRDQDGKVVHWFGTNTDISEQLRVEEALRESNERFRILSENSPDCIALHDRELRHLYVNPAITRITGLPLEAFLGKTVGEAGIPPEVAATLDSNLRPVLESGQPNRCDLMIPTTAGPRHFTWRSVPIPDADGTPKAVLAIASDITERKLAEEEIRGHMEQLKATNEELTRFNKASVGRELRMIELKREVNELCRLSGQGKRYPLDFEEQP